MSPLLAVILAMTVLPTAGVPQSATSACAPTFTSITESRALPHLYVEQGLQSLPAVYPRHELLLAKRSSEIGGVAYSLLVYRKEKGEGDLTLEGAAAVGQSAWRFSAGCSSRSAMEGLVVILERISRLRPR